MNYDEAKAKIDEIHEWARNHKMKEIGTMKTIRANCHFIDRGIDEMISLEKMVDGTDNETNTNTLRGQVSSKTEAMVGLTSNPIIFTGQASSKTKAQELDEWLKQENEKPTRDEARRMVGLDRDTEKERIGGCKVSIEDWSGLTDKQILQRVLREEMKKNLTIRINLKKEKTRNKIRRLFARVPEFDRKVKNDMKIKIDSKRIPESKFPNEVWQRLFDTCRND